MIVKANLYDAQTARFKFVIDPNPFLNSLTSIVTALVTLLMESTKGPDRPLAESVPVEPPVWRRRVEEDLF